MPRLRLLPILFACIITISRQHATTETRAAELINDQRPTWFKQGFLVASLLMQQNRITGHFVKSVFAKKFSYAAFGVDWAVGLSGRRHAAFLRLLLLVAGDVESNPGPTTNEYETVDTHLTTAGEATPDMAPTAASHSYEEDNGEQHIFC